MPSSDTAPLPAVADSGEREPILPWKSGEPEFGVPAQIVATWTDTVLQQSGKGAKRGFGGRLYFYGPGGSRPIAVEGQLVVYAFDETGREPTNNKPTKRFVFPPEQFALHRSESELGVSYSFWLPWDEAALGMADVSLIARFEPVKGGTLVVSDQTTVRLPGQLDGPRVVSEPSTFKQVQPVQTASHETPTNDASRPRSATEPSTGSTMGTTTIALPEGTRAHRVATGAKPSVGPPQTSISYRDPARADHPRPIQR